MPHTLSIWLLVGAMLSAQAPDTRVASIQVRGNVRYTAEEVTRLSGLEIGRAAAAADLTAAANRLASTGLFESVRYSYSTASRAISVTLEIVEAAWKIPIVLDNFISIPDEELIAAVRAEVPSFDGTLPDNVVAPGFLTQGLQNVLKARGLPGRIELMPQGDLATGKIVRYVYAVRDPSPKMCALQVKGASGIAEADLLDALKGAIGGEYSRNFLTSSARGTLVDMYRRKGYWRAAFGPPLAVPGACAGAAVTLSVVEGLVYAWDHAEWSGNQALTSEALNKALAMKPGGVADAGRIDVGLRAVARLYGAQGYLAMRSTMDPRLDDAARTATFAIAIVEGPQFRMGTVSVVGVREADARMLAKKWRLAPGDVYDDSYDDRFHDDVLAPLRTSTGGTGHVERQIDVDARTVNVRIVF